MKKEIKKLWVDALRSGEYEQGKYQLVCEGPEGDQFCCLGVLTNIYVEQTGNAEVWERSEYSLDECVQKWAGLNSDNPVIAPAGLLFLTAAVYNDRGVPFSKIADLIEDNL